MISAIRASEDSPGLAPPNPDVTTPRGVAMVGRARLVIPTSRPAAPEPLRAVVDVPDGRLVVMDYGTTVKLVVVQADGDGSALLDLGFAGNDELIDALYAAKLRRRTVTL